MNTRPTASVGLRPRSRPIATTSATSTRSPRVGATAWSSAASAATPSTSPVPTTTCSAMVARRPSMPWAIRSGATSRSPIPWLRRTTSDDIGGGDHNHDHRGAGNVRDGRRRRGYDQDRSRERRQHRPGRRRRSAVGPNGALVKGPYDERRYRPPTTRSRSSASRTR